MGADAAVVPLVCDETRTFVSAEGPLIALGAGVATLMITLARRDTPPQALMVIAAAGSFSALVFIFTSPLIAAVILIEATGLGGPRLRKEGLLVQEEATGSGDDIDQDRRRRDANSERRLCARDGRCRETNEPDPPEPDRDPVGADGEAGDPGIGREQEPVPEPAQRMTVPWNCTPISLHSGRGSVSQRNSVVLSVGLDPDPDPASTCTRPACAHRPS